MCRGKLTGSFCHAQMIQIFQTHSYLLKLDIEECASNPCQNGATCEEYLLGYECICPPGYNGTHCEQGK